MSAAPATATRTRLAGAGAGEWLAIAGTIAGLAAVVALRWFAVTRGAPGLVVGVGFATALLAVWALAGGGRKDHPPEIRWREAIAPRRLAVALVAGTVFGLVLVLVAVAGSLLGGSVLPAGFSRPAAPFLPWALVTIGVATAEEGILRGALFDRLRSRAGLIAAIAVTTVVFALMHVPLYGWQVVPLDVAVGLGFAGLRLATRSIVAPAMAHSVADLATWWL